jgi:hypothetical protein
MQRAQARRRRLGSVPQLSCLPRASLAVSVHTATFLEKSSAAACPPRLNQLLLDIPPPVLCILMLHAWREEFTGYKQSFCSQLVNLSAWFLSKRLFKNMKLNWVRY